MSLGCFQKYPDESLMLSGCQDESRMLSEVSVECRMLSEVADECLGCPDES
jgi:hypothetical protein